MLALIDSDSIAFAAACAAQKRAWSVELDGETLCVIHDKEEAYNIANQVEGSVDECHILKPEGIARWYADKLIRGILDSCQCDAYQFYLSPSKTFRNQYEDYKANRTAPKPLNLESVRNHLIDKWEAVVCENIEADDQINIVAGKINMFADLLESNVERIPEAGCWLWTAYCNPDGYGQRKFKGTTYRMHRLSWEVHNGEIPEGMHVLHKCDTPSCVNPDHLYLGTHSDNMKDMWDKGRHSKPTHGFMQKYSDELKEYVRRNRKHGNGKRLSEETGIPVGTIYAIWQGRV